MSPWNPMVSYTETYSKFNPCSLKIARRWKDSSKRDIPCVRQDIPCVPSRTCLVFKARHSLCSKKDIPFVRSRTFLVFDARHSVCSTQDNPCVPNGSGSKIARMAPISTIFWRNRSRRPDLIFRKFSHRLKIFAPSKNFRDKRKIFGTNEQTNDKVWLRRRR